MTHHILPVKVWFSLTLLCPPRTVYQSAPISPETKKKPDYRKKIWATKFSTLVWWKSNIVKNFELFRLTSPSLHCHIQILELLVFLNSLANEPFLPADEEHNLLTSENKLHVNMINVSLHVHTVIIFIIFFLFATDYTLDSKSKEPTAINGKW